MSQILPCDVVGVITSLCDIKTAFKISITTSSLLPIVSTHITTINAADFHTPQLGVNSSLIKRMSELSGIEVVYSSSAADTDSTNLTEVILASASRLRVLQAGKIVLRNIFKTIIVNHLDRYRLESLEFRGTTPKAIVQFLAHPLPKLRELTLASDKEDWLSDALVNLAKSTSRLQSLKIECPSLQCLLRDEGALLRKICQANSQIKTIDLCESTRLVSVVNMSAAAEPKRALPWCHPPYGGLHLLTRHQLLQQLGVTAPVLKVFGMSLWVFYIQRVLTKSNIEQNNSNHDYKALFEECYSCETARDLLVELDSACCWPLFQRILSQRSSNDSLAAALSMTVTRCIRDELGKPSFLGLSLSVHLRLMTIVAAYDPTVVDNTNILKQLLDLVSNKNNIYTAVEIAPQFRAIEDLRLTRLVNVLVASGVPGFVQLLETLSRAVCGAVYFDAQEATLWDVLLEFPVGLLDWLQQPHCDILATNADGFYRISWAMHNLAPAEGCSEDSIRACYEALFEIHSTKLDKTKLKSIRLSLSLVEFLDSHPQFIEVYAGLYRDSKAVLEAKQEWWATKYAKILLRLLTFQRQQVAQMQNRTNRSATGQWWR